MLATAEAEKLPEGQRAVFGNGFKSHWSEVFENNPKIARDLTGTWIPNYPGRRPYIKTIRETNYIFHEDFRAPYGKIYLTDQEREWAQKQAPDDFVLVEPYTKDQQGAVLHLGRNKAWNKWDELLKVDLPWLQIGIRPPKTKRYVRTETFRRAMAMVERAKLVVTTDGGLHHAAAALGTPAIVLWGGFVSPKILGYPTHINIWNGAKPCGWFKSECPHCKEAMDSISVEQVKKHL